MSDKTIRAQLLKSGNVKAAESEKRDTFGAYFDRMAQQQARGIAARKAKMASKNA